jgi:hypothetical protein
MKIAFGDKARVGKDTAANYMISRYGGQRFSFAENLYKIANFIQDLCGIPREKDRKLLQIVGTEWGREKNPDLWLEATLKKIKEIEDENVVNNFYITDVRFRNEFNRLKKEGWIMIKIKRDTEGMVGGVEGHKSETNDIEDEEWNYVLENNKEIEKFYRDLDNIYVIENLMKEIKK